MCVCECVGDLFTIEIFDKEKKTYTPPPRDCRQRSLAVLLSAFHSSALPPLERCTLKDDDLEPVDGARTVEKSKIFV